MDELLETRYRLLFQSYAMGETGAVGRFKALIQDWNEAHRQRLRWDAAFFLLVNLDQMLIRPYFGEFQVEGTRFLPFPQGFSANQWFERTQEATRMVLDYLDRNGGEAISSHDALKAIEETWERLALLFGWG